MDKIIKSLKLTPQAEEIYAEKGIEHFNFLYDDMINQICHELIESCHLSDESFKLSEFKNVRGILEYYWFTALAVISDNRVYYLIEGEGDWDEPVGFVIKNDNLVYIGVDYEEYL